MFWTPYNLDSALTGRRRALLTGFVVNGYAEAHRTIDLTLGYRF